MFKMAALSMKRMVSNGCKSSVSSLLSPIFQSSKGVKHAPHSLGKNFSTVNKTGKRSVGILGVPISKGQVGIGRTLVYDGRLLTGVI